MMLSRKLRTKDCDIDEIKLELSKVKSRQTDLDVFIGKL